MEYKIATTQAEFFDLMSVRREVFINEQQVDVNLEQDELDAAAIHLIAISDHQVVGTCRIVIQGTNGHIGRMAVLKPYRGQKIGRHLMELAEQTAKEKHLLTLDLNAQCHASAFYERLGYQVNSEIFEEANIQHQSMLKTL